MKIINLLPTAKQRELRYEAMYHSLLTVFWISMFSFALVFAAQVVTKVYLQFEAQSIAENINRVTSEVNKQDNAAVKAKITAVNNLITDFKNLEDTNPKWSKLLKAFVPVVPEGVHIENLRVNTRDLKVDISGFAPTRDSVIALYNNILSDSKDFNSIDYPFENVSKPANINFHFTFYVDRSIIQ